jgi:hypothetical protein
VQPPSKILIFLSVLREPLFADWADKKVGGYAGPASIAAVLTGRLHPDVSNPHSPPLFPFALVVFNKGEQFFVIVALVHAVKTTALAPHFLRGDFPESFDFRKFLFAESAFNNEKPVDMPKSGVIIMDGGDKGDAGAELRFDLLKGIAGYLP